MKRHLPYVLIGLASMAVTFYLTTRPMDPDEAVRQVLATDPHAKGAAGNCQQAVDDLVAAGPVTPGSGEEGAPARLFQLILLAELAAIGMFAVRWLPEAPRPASRILAAQVVLAALPIVLITVLEASARG